MFFTGIFKRCSKKGISLDWGLKLQCRREVCCAYLCVGNLFAEKKRRVLLLCTRGGLKEIFKGWFWIRAVWIIL